MAEFPRVDVNEIEQELSIIRRAREEGRRDRPATTDISLDEIQLGILAAINERLNGARSDGEKSLQSLEVKLGAIDLEAISHALRVLKNDTEMEIERTKANFRDRLVSFRQRERQMLRELNFFQLENELHREANYPESEILHWAIIMILIVTESLANSYFFAKGSDLGLLGGTLQALLISVVNIGAALFAGVFTLRNLQHIEKPRVRMGTIGLVVYLGFMLFFNLATAHYRAQLGIDPLTAVVKALTSLMRNPFAIRDFDATVLLFIGIIFSIGALVKSYLADDRYPGFGKIDRQYQIAEEFYQEGKSELRDAINGVIDHARDILNEYVGNAREASTEFALLVARAESVINGYPRHAEELAEARHTLLNIYRTTNVKARSSPPPEYFEDYPHTDKGESLPSEELQKARQRVGDIEKMLAEFEEQSAEVSEELKTVNGKALQDVEAFFKIIEAEADEKLTSDSALGISDPGEVE